MGVVIFNGKSSDDYGIEVEHPPRYKFAKRNYTLTTIPGKSGSVVYDDNSYQNVDKEYDIAFGVGEGETYTDAAIRVSQWLSTPGGYKRLEDTYEPDVYREAIFNEAGDLENIYNQGGRAKIKFSCKPFRYLKIGEISEKIGVSSTDPGSGQNSGSIAIENPTIYDSYPVFEVHVETNGSGVLTVNGTTIEILTYSGGIIYIDCENQNATNVFDAYNETNFLGTTTTEITDGSDANPIVIYDEGTQISRTVIRGDICEYNNVKYIWNGAIWVVYNEQPSTVLNLNQYINAPTFPVLAGSASNEISFTGLISKVYVTPRWWIK